MGAAALPVFIDGRLAGALAAGWDGSLEPLYLVRPIEDMLKSRNTASGGYFWIRRRACFAGSLRFAGSDFRF
jgi:hypothetical protein